LTAATDLLAKSFGGAAKTNADTFAGKMEIFNQRVSEAKETIGSAILTAIQPFAEKWLPKIAKVVTDVSDGFAGKGGKGGGVALGTSIRTVATAIGDFFTAINTSNDGKQKTINDNLQTMANVMNNIAGAINSVTGAFTTLGNLMDNPIGRRATAAFRYLPTNWILNNLTSDNQAPLQANKSINGIAYTWDDTKKAWYSIDIAGKQDYKINSDVKKQLGTPARALGGPVMGGQSYLVGEHGPEMFTPMGGGNITPNGRLGGGGHTFILNGIIDAESARRAIERVLQQSSIRTGAVNIQGSLI